MKKLFNAFLYQVIWLVSVLGGNSGALAVMPLLLLHLRVVEETRVELKMMGFLLILGILVDGALQYVGFFRFTHPGIPIPFWLMVVWLGLAITINHSLAWTKTWPLLTLVFGALGGPFAYWAGARLGAVSFGWPLAQTLPLLGVLWAGIWWLVMYFSKWVTVVEKGR